MPKEIWRTANTANLKEGALPKENLELAFLVYFLCIFNFCLTFLQFRIYFSSRAFTFYFLKALGCWLSRRLTSVLKLLTRGRFSLEIEFLSCEFLMSWHMKPTAYVSFKILNQRTFFTRDRISFLWILDELTYDHHALPDEVCYTNVTETTMFYLYLCMVKKMLPRRLTNNENIDCLSWLKVCLDTFLF